MHSGRAAFERLSNFFKKICVFGESFFENLPLISVKGVLSRIFKKTGEEVLSNMRDTARRVALVKKRVRENTRRRQRREVRGLSAACVVLFAALMKTAGIAIGPGQVAAQGLFGAMLLQESAGGYVLVGVAAFTAAAALTVVCMRLHEREKRKRKNPKQKEENTP